MSEKEQQILPQYYRELPEHPVEQATENHAVTPVEEIQDVPQELGMALTGLLLITLAMVFVRHDITTSYLPVMMVLTLMIVSGLVLSGRALYIQTHLNKASQDLLNYSHRTYDESVKDRIIMVNPKEKKVLKGAVLTGFVIGSVHLGFMVYRLIDLFLKLAEGLGS